MKTHQQILDRMEAVKEVDWMGTQRSDLVQHLPFALAKPFLKGDVTEDQWIERTKDVMTPMDSIKDYLPFAWDKANNGRGLSAGRSLEHILTWLWLEGYDRLVKEHFNEYDAYGKKQLVIASLLVNFDWQKADDGVWDGISDSEKAHQIDHAGAIAHHAEKET